VEYIKNKNIQITFTIKEDLYFQFKTFCKAEKKNPAAVIKEFIKKYASLPEDELAKAYLDEKHRQEGE